MTIKSLVRQVAIEAPAELYLFWLSYFAFGWGVLLYFNSYLLTVSTSYDVFQSFNFEPITWLLIYTGIGVFGLYACLTPSAKIIQIASMFMFLLWSFTVFCFYFASGTVGTGTFVYGSFAAIAAWTFLRIGNNSFQSLWNG